jgi:hypothetical protein
LSAVPFFLPLGKRNFDFMRGVGMYYIWELDTQEVVYEFFRCGMEQFKGWTDVRWQLGMKVDHYLPPVLRYYAVNMLEPEDFPRTGAGQHFLVSDRIVNLLKGLNVPGIDYYVSEIIRPNGEVIKGYSTLNILNALDCIDIEKSQFSIVKYGPAGVYKFTKLCLDHSKIPPQVKLFKMKKKFLILAHKGIKDAFEAEKITGVYFKPINVLEEIPF